MTAVSRTDRGHRYYWSERFTGVTVVSGQRVIGPWMYHESDRRSLISLDGQSSTPPLWAQDLLRVARAAFVADKDALRKPAKGAPPGVGEDGWTRHISLSVPVCEPDFWRDGPLACLTALVETLTGDRWDITPRRPDEGSPFAQVLDFTVDAHPEVGLFSGGLDSLSWAAQRANQRPGTPLILVMFGEDKAQQAQQRALTELTALARRSGRTVVRHLHSQDVRWPGEDKERGETELSTRTRSLLYLAAAVRTAAAEGAAKVCAPENGQIAFNPPLTAARSAACSTRSVHPHTLRQLNELIAALGGQIEVVNPLWRRTKGEVCRDALDAGLTPESLEATVSCGRRPWGRGRSCGRCWPCLVRQAGLHHALGFDRTRYKYQPWSDEGDTYADWADLVRWLWNDFRLRDLLADTPLPPETDRRAAFQTITRGRTELRDWLRSRGVVFGGPGELRQPSTSS